MQHYVIQKKTKNLITIIFATSFSIVPISSRRSCDLFFFQYTCVHICYISITRYATIFALFNHALYPRLWFSSLRNFYLLLAISLIPFSTSNTTSTPPIDWIKGSLSHAMSSALKFVDTCQRTSWKISRIINVLVLRRRKTSIPCRSVPIAQQKKRSEVSFSEDS